MKRLRTFILAVGMAAPIMIPLQLSAKDGDFSAMEFIFGISTMQFSQNLDRFAIEVATLENIKQGSGYFTDTVYHINSKSNEHKMGTFGFNFYFYNEKGLVSKFNFDLRLDSEFEFFQFRLDGFVGYNFLNMLANFNVIGGASLSYLGNTTALFSKPDYSASLGATDQLYLLTSKLENPENTTNEPYLFQFGPYALTFLAGINANMPLFSFGLLEFTYAFHLVDAPMSAESILNSDGTSGFSIPSVGFSRKSIQLPSFFEVKASIFLGEQNLVVAYRIQRHMSLGLTETTIYGGVQFTK